MPRQPAKLLPLAAALLSLGSSSLGGPGWAQPQWQPLAPGSGSAARETASPPRLEPRAGLPRSCPTGSQLAARGPR